MNDFEQIELAFDILEDAEVMHDFDDRVWISIDKDLWDQFQKENHE